MEKVLRSTEAQCIYLLIRPKRNMGVYERIDQIFKDPLFEKLHKIKKDPTKFVVPIIGDCFLPNLGISDEDRDTLIENVEIVVHSAATVRFTEPLNTALNINVRATLDLIKLAKKMQKLQSYVHVSSAFANCTHHHIAEQFYADKICISADNICKMADIVGPDIMNNVTEELRRDFPNTYCYTKALAEEAVLTHGSDLPICIFRPGIVISTAEEPVTGWIDNLYGPTAILYGVSYGVLHVIYAREESTAHVVPVDLCANEMIACAWNTAKTAKQMNLPPPIYNLVPDDKNTLYWREYRNTIWEYGTKIPLSRSIWYPFLIITKNLLWYKLMCLICHLIPGYLFDFCLLLMGKKRRLVKTYRKIHKQTEVLQYFVVHNWTFSMTNTKQLWKSMSPDDQRLYNFDIMSLNWTEYFQNSLQGMRKFLAKEDPVTIPKGLQLHKRLLILHRATQVLFYGCGLTILYQTSLKILQMLQMDL